jgi:gamma-glutamyltranspeptidase/glutathione hydrolase
MTPILIFHQQQPLVAYGSPGGSTIISSMLNMTLNLIDHGLPVQEAIDAPRLTQTSANGHAQLEQGVAENVMQALCNLGDLPPSCQAQLLSLPPVDIGAIQAVTIEPGQGRQFGGADKRRIGSVISVRREEIKTPISAAGADNGLQ